MPRTLTSFIDGFLELTAELPTPEIFRRWSAIWTIAAACEQKLWLKPFGKAGPSLYPGLYVVLTGPATAGKTVSITQARNILIKLKDHYMSPTNVSRASLMDALHKAERHFIIYGKDAQPLNFHSLAVCSTELGVLIAKYDQDFMNHLTDIWDCSPYSEEKRTGKVNLDMASPQINLLAGTTPAFLREMLPDGAWDQGFMSRVLLIFSGDEVKATLQLEEDSQGIILNTRLQDMLTETLSHIGKVGGKYFFNKEAATALKAWEDGGRKPVPDHPNLLAGYNGRRVQQLLKLCMISAIDRSDNLQINAEDYSRALGWLLDAEHRMTDIFKAMRKGGDSQLINETWHFALEWQLNRKNPIPEGMLVQFLAERTPAFNISNMMKTMEAMGIIEAQLTSVGRAFRVKARKASGTL